MVICLEQGADLYIAQRISLPLTVSCFSKIQIGFTFLVPAHPGSPGQRAVKRMCVCCVLYQAKQKLSTAGVNSLALLIKKLLIIVSRPSRLLECLVIAATPCFSTQGTQLVHCSDVFTFHYGQLYIKLLEQSVGICTPDWRITF